MSRAILINIAETTSFIAGRVVRGWNAKDDVERNFELAQAFEMLKNLESSVRCEITRQDEIDTKLRLAKKDLKDGK